MSFSHLLNTSSEATGPATAKIVEISAGRRVSSPLTPFTDNLDYLQALEEEALLTLIRGLLRHDRQKWRENPDWVQAVEAAGLLPMETDLPGVDRLLSEVAECNRKRTEISERSGVELYFPRFCREHDLDAPQRTILLLLFMHATSKKCAQAFDCLQSEQTRFENSGTSIGTLIEILGSDYREQLACRRNFSIQAPLMRNEIVLPDRGRFCSSQDILQESVSLDPRYIRYLLGDNNLYDAGLHHIRREQSTVRLSQVILPEKSKEELVAQIGSYLAFRNRRESSELDDFYGYGTALTLLFHGPSGTGKTMTARALAAHFNMPIYSFHCGSANEKIDQEEVIRQLFREASLQGGIAFFDEADDLFQEDSRFSRTMLVEIEKAHGVVILATNKPVGLDPAMDRRLAMKVFFPLPNAEMRYRMWQTLLPAFIRPAPDVDLRSMAERYAFSGGLIKNTLLLAIQTALHSGKGEEGLITAEHLEQAAAEQSRQMIDMSKWIRIHHPVRGISELPLDSGQKEQLARIARAYQQLKAENLGLNLMIRCDHEKTAFQTAEALARECRLKVRSANFTEVISRDRDEMVTDPVSQKRMFPLEYMFTERTGDEAMTLIMDNLSILQWRSNQDFRQDELDLLFGHLRTHRGFFCLICSDQWREALPVEFHCYLDLEYPSEEVQLQTWEKFLKSSDFSEDALVALVEKYPMHISEIEFIAERIRIESLIRADSGRSTPDLLRTFLSRYRRKRHIPELFGNSLGKDQQLRFPKVPRLKTNKNKTTGTDRADDFIPF